MRKERRREINKGREGKEKGLQINKEKERNGWIKGRGSFRLSGKLKKTEEDSLT